MSLTLQRWIIRAGLAAEVLLLAVLLIAASPVATLAGAVITAVSVAACRQYLRETRGGERQ